SGALMSTHVAATISKGLVHEENMSMIVVLCALLGAITWNLLTWWWGLPSSSSHALIGSLLGSAYFSSADGAEHIEWMKVFNKVVVPMFTSPVLGFLIGFLIMAG